MKGERTVCDTESATHQTGQSKHKRGSTRFRLRKISSGTKDSPIMISSDTIESRGKKVQESSDSVEQIEILDEKPLAAVPAGQPIPTTNSAWGRAELAAELLYFEKQMREDLETEELNKEEEEGDQEVEGPYHRVPSVRDQENPPSPIAPVSPPVCPEGWYQISSEYFPFYSEAMAEDHPWQIGDPPHLEYTSHPMPNWGEPSEIGMDRMGDSIPFSYGSYGEIHEEEMMKEVGDVLGDWGETPQFVKMDDVIQRREEQGRPVQEIAPIGASKGKTPLEVSEDEREQVDKGVEKYMKQQEKWKNRLIKKLTSPLTFYSDRKGPTQRKRANQGPP